MLSIVFMTYELNKNRNSELHCMMVDSLPVRQALAVLTGMTVGEYRLRKLSESERSFFICIADCEGSVNRP